MVFEDKVEDVVVVFVEGFWFVGGNVEARSGVGMIFKVCVAIWQILGVVMLLLKESVRDKGSEGLVECRSLVFVEGLNGVRDDSDRVWVVEEVGGMAKEWQDVGQARQVVFV